MGFSLDPQSVAGLAVGPDRFSASRRSGRVSGLADALGDSTRFVPRPAPRQRRGRFLDFGAQHDDKAFGIARPRTELERRGSTAVIPPRPNRARKITRDFEMYKWRRLIENFFGTPKSFRRIATRYEKTVESCSTNLAATMLEFG